MDDLKLYRCTIIENNSKYFLGEDVFKNKFYIAKNEATKKYKVGTNDSFYAKVVREGILFKKEVLHPITSAEYEKIACKKNNNTIDNTIDKKIIEKLRNITSTV
ncbi:hypothetical protein CPJCM30710_29000 [Clostridium polyendosporum]|uniref:Uncharacterized protein n=1 Tax=Clostridium polyendosporum TaxID=69208 RepID=A0A919S1Q0_9CLOT|nr:hypothetical protein [Clostridium polyendosporum]GIM30234.1 hypothetical protein CPJCM30710_29000 [Clostridium polyendosporum]